MRHARDRPDRRGRLRLHRGARARSRPRSTPTSPRRRSKRPASASTSRWASTSTPTSPAATRTRPPAARRSCTRPLAVARDCGGDASRGILTRASASTTSQPPPAASPCSGDILRAGRRGGGAERHHLGLEVVNRYETNMLNTASQGVEMCRRIGAPNVKVHLDVYHMNIEESDIASAIVETGDLSRLLPHRRHRTAATSAPAPIDLAGVFRALVRAATRARSPSRASRPRVVGQPLEGILGIWRNLWEDGFDLATHALMYTKAQLKAAQEVAAPGRAQPAPAARPPDITPLSPARRRAAAPGPCARRARGCASRSAPPARSRAPARISTLEHPPRGLRVEVAGRLVRQQQRAARWRAPAPAPPAAARRPRAPPAGAPSRCPSPTALEQLARPRLRRRRARRRPPAAAAPRSRAPRTPAAGGGTGRRSPTASRRSRVRARVAEPGGVLPEQPHRPAVGASSSPAMCSSVDFPAPDGATSADHLAGRERRGSRRSAPPPPPACRGCRPWRPPSSREHLTHSAAPRPGSAARRCAPGRA